MNKNKKRPLDAYLLPLFLISIVITCTLFALKPWMPPLASDRKSIDQLFFGQAAATAVACTLVMFLAAYFIWRYNEGTRTSAIYFHDNIWLEITWTVITAGLIALLGFWGDTVWKNIILASPPVNALRVEVIGQQFAWTFRYPSPDGRFARVIPTSISDTNGLALDQHDPHSHTDLITKGELFLPVNRPVELFIRSTDVIHSFFLPNFRVKQDAVPGLTVSTWFTPTKVGDYEIACAQLCGMSHYTMRGLVHVLEVTDFKAKIDNLRNHLK